MVTVKVKTPDGTARRAYLIEVLHIPNKGNFGIVAFREGDEPLDTVPIEWIKLEKSPEVSPSLREINNRLKNP
jgi:hypothetical protein